MGTVSAAVKEDLMQVKDALDLHLRGSQRSVDTLKPHAEALGRIAGTLAMIGLDGASARIGAQRDALAAIADGQRPASADALLEIAGTLLQVDASLDEQVERMGSHNDGAGNEALASETRRVTAVLLQEAAHNIARVRESTLTAMLDGWHPAELAEVPRLLHEVGGALRMLDQAHPADLATGIQGYVQSELLDREISPDANTLERVADAVSSLEMYLEGLEDGGRREDLLDITRASLATLGYWPLPKSASEATFGERPEAEPAQLATAQVVTAQDQPADTTATPAPEAAAVVTAAAPVSDAASGFEQTGDEIDDEIREVFLEEFEEEIGNLGELLPAWRSEPDNTELLRPIRRVFHTLKGSGRLVGAKLLGEFSWKIENMLNRVLDGSRPASPAVIALVEQAHANLPQLHAALRGAGAVSADLDGLQQVADRVAGGEEVRFVAAASAAATAAVETAEVESPAAEPEPEQPQGIPAPVDPVLLEILEAEVTGHLQTIEHWLRTSAPRPDETLLRALHTSNGAFAMTEVPAITDTLGQAEAYVKRLLLADRPALPEGVAALGEVADTVRETLVALRSADPRVFGTPELAARLTALRDALPDPTAFDTRALDALGAQGLAVPDAVEPFEPGALDALLQCHAGLASDHAEAERLASERAEAELRATQAAEAALLEAERIAFEQAEAERVEAERVEAERLEAERVEAERLEAERLEAERLEAERLEAERLEAERVEAERLEAERVEAERLEAERLEAERLEAERLEAERLEAARLEAARLEGGRRERERLDAERLEAERVEAARLEAERLEAERLEAARLEAERLEAERLEAERLEAERLEAERLEAERLEAERLEAERLEAERR